jgi:hypothetical protein
MRMTAWAVPRPYELLNDPCIVVVTYSPDGGVSSEYVINEDPGTDIRADMILREHGFDRISPWTRRRGVLWAADVEEIA